MSLDPIFNLEQTTDQNLSKSQEVKSEQATKSLLKSSLEKILEENPVEKKPTFQSGKLKSAAEKARELHLASPVKPEKPTENSLSDLVDSVFNGGDPISVVGDVQSADTEVPAVAETNLNSTNLPQAPEVQTLELSEKETPKADKRVKKSEKAGRNKKSKLVTVGKVGLTLSVIGAAGIAAYDAWAPSVFGPPRTATRTLAPISLAPQGRPVADVYKGFAKKINAVFKNSRYTIINNPDTCTSVILRLDKACANTLADPLQSYNAVSGFQVMRDSQNSAGLRQETQFRTNYRPKSTLVETEKSLVVGIIMDPKLTSEAVIIDSCRGLGTDLKSQVSNLKAAGPAFIPNIKLSKSEVLDVSSLLRGVGVKSVVDVAATPYASTNKISFYVPVSQLRNDLTVSVGKLAPVSLHKAKNGMHRAP